MGFLLSSPIVLGASSTVAPSEDPIGSEATVNRAVLSEDPVGSEATVNRAMLSEDPVGSEAPANRTAPSEDPARHDNATDAFAERRLPPPIQTARDGAGDSGRHGSVLSPEPLRQPKVASRSPTPLLARVDELRLVQPTSTPVAVGFHEAATHRARPLSPIGQLATNRNSTRFTPAGDTLAGRSFVVLHSRGRAAGPTSAIDVAMRDDDPVLAPVSGRVVSVRPYLLEGRYEDLRVEIQPDDAPQMRVVIIHIDDVVVKPGDRLTAGETTVAATARRLPFFSQIDELTAPDRWPHVHIEVQPVPPPEPADPHGSEDRVDPDHPAADVGQGPVPEAVRSTGPAAAETSGTS